MVIDEFDTQICKENVLNLLDCFEGNPVYEAKSISDYAGSLLDMLKSNGYYMAAPCNSKGTCGKCKIKIIKGNIPVSQSDKSFFTQKELDQGYRLACMAYPRFDCTFEAILDGEESIDVLTKSNIAEGRTKTHANESKAKEVGTKKGIVVDIGTTTIAMQLISLATGEVLNTYASVNKQRAYGTDVISRIEASIAGQKDILRKIIQRELQVGIEYLAADDIANISKVIIGANTTMVHLLMGYDCNTLGVYPFTPVNITTIYTSLSDLLEANIGEAEVIIYSGISTYVGGDIVAGLLALDFEKKEKVSVLIDLGTNGEMAIGNKDKLLVTSTAAGPAFEGGNIICGVASVAGAICSVDINEDKVTTKTIGDKQAIGICGTGVIEAVAGLLEEKVIDETGLLEDKYFDDGFLLAKGKGDYKIAIYQKDIREIQLAKAAVRAGVETLISRYGVDYDEIEHIYIAGAFGYQMDIPKALSIGLLPEELEQKIKTVGNTCLSGTRKYLLEENSEQAIWQIIDSSSEIQLSNDKKFNELYVKYMYFD